MLPHLGRSMLAFAVDTQNVLRKNHLDALLGVLGGQMPSINVETQRTCATATDMGRVPVSYRERRKRATKRPSLNDRLTQAYTEDFTDSDPRPVVGLAIIERYPIVFPELPEWRTEFLDWQSEWNAWKYKTYPSEWLNCDKEVDEESQSGKFEPEPIETEADRNGDIRSLRRRTPGYLYLMLKESGPGDLQWRFPKAEVKETETLRDTVQRAVTDSVGDSIETHVFGNVPCAHLQNEQERSFMMLGVVLDGNVSLQKGIPATDYAWLTKSEVLEAYTSDPSMCETIKEILEH